MKGSDVFSGHGISLDCSIESNPFWISLRVITHFLSRMFLKTRVECSIFVLKRSSSTSPPALGKHSCFSLKKLRISVLLIDLSRIHLELLIILWKMPSRSSAEYFSIV